MNMRVLKDFGEVRLGSDEYDSRKTRLHVKLVRRSGTGQFFLQLQQGSTNGDHRPMYLSLESIEALDSFISLSQKLIANGSEEPKPAQKFTIPNQEEHLDWAERQREVAPWIGPITTSDVSSQGIGKAVEGEVKRK